MVITIESITPHKAKQYLALNRNIRRLNNVRVSEYKRLMEAGEFETTHQGIAFAILDGALVDGQHRLTAIVESGKTIKMSVARGLTEDEVRVLDCGKVRGNDVRLGIDTRFATIVTLAAYQSLDAGRKPMPSELMCMRDALQDSHDALMAACGACKKRLTTAPIRLGALLNMQTDVGREYVLVQYPALVRGDFDIQSPFVQAFYRRLAESDRRGMSKDAALATAYRVFDPQKKALRSVSHKDLSLDEIRTVLLDLATKN